MMRSRLLGTAGFNADGFIGTWDAVTSPATTGPAPAPQPTPLPPPKPLGGWSARMSGPEEAVEAVQGGSRPPPFEHGDLLAQSEDFKRGRHATAEEDTDRSQECGDQMEHESTVVTSPGHLHGATAARIACYGFDNPRSFWLQTPPDTYIDRVMGEDILSILACQLEETLALLSDISEEQSLYRYAEDKWSMRQVLNHITDSERVFALRALWFARGFETPLPSYDQGVAARGAEADCVPWAAHVEEFRRVRLASISLFEKRAAFRMDADRNRER